MDTGGPGYGRHAAQAAATTPDRRRTAGCPSRMVCIVCPLPFPYLCPRQQLMCVCAVLDAQLSHMTRVNFRQTTTQAHNEVKPPCVVYLLVCSSPLGAVQRALFCISTGRAARPSTSSTTSCTTTPKLGPQSSPRCARKLVVYTYFGAANEVLSTPSAQHLYCLPHDCVFVPDQSRARNSAPYRRRWR